MKLRESISGAKRGLARELVASLLASRLGLSAPAPCLVEVTREFAESIQMPDVRSRMLSNLGCQFGTKQLSDSWHAVPFSGDLPVRLFDAAASVRGHARTTTGTACSHFPSICWTLKTSKPNHTGCWGG